MIEVRLKAGGAGCFYVVQALVATGYILTASGVVCFHKWWKGPYVLAIGVVPINLCKCGLVGIRARKWPRMWNTGMRRQLNREI